MDSVNLTSLGGKLMGKLKSTGLIDWNAKQGYISGRKWRSLRLPVNEISAIRRTAEKFDLSPWELIDKAIKESSYGKEYTYNPWKTFADIFCAKGQADLFAESR